jgi:hypothetical protein
MTDTHLLIAGVRNPVLADYATHCLRRGRDNLSVVGSREVCRDLAGRADCYEAETFSPADLRRPGPGGCLGGVVLFLDRRITRRGRALVEAVAALAAAERAGCVCVVSSFRVHLGDRDAACAEAFACQRLRGLPARVAVLRPGHVLSRRSPLAVFLRDSWPWLAVVPSRLRGCCVEGEELFAAIERELVGSGPPTTRTYTLLGENRPWRARLRERLPGRAGRVLTWAMLPLAPLRLVTGPLVGLLARRSRLLRPWHVETLHPHSRAELLALYNKYNYRHVKVVGYNNGVTHFGQQFPGKTLVSTVGCNRARVYRSAAAFDAGVTVRQAMDELRPHGKELPVLPNYSYVSLGTAFFVPIHGSASRCSTIADTIEKVVLYDPVWDRVVVARRHEAAFGQFLYNLSADVLLLRLRLATKDRSSYYVQRLDVPCPSAEEILAHFHDPGPSNVEVRKAGSKAETVSIFRYFTGKADAGGEALEMPRDAIGRVWDRLEENPVSSVLFHGLVRRFAHHVELFLSEEEFATFWDTHRALSIEKIQLRFIRRDGFPHSPFRKHDCVSADLFMWKKHREAFERYRKDKLRGATLNPGKHST